MAEPGPVFWTLTCRGRPPVELRMGERRFMGRHQDNDLVLADGQVSRRHARVVWEQGLSGPYVGDEGSTNGVLVNGLAVDGRRLLHSGDVLTVGPFEVEVAEWVPTSEGVMRTDQSGSDYRIAWDEDEDSQDGLALDTEDLHEELRRAERQLRTGTLSVKVCGLEGEVVFCAGKVATARLGGLRGEEALHQIARIHTGAAYRFSARVRLVEGSLDLSISELLDASSTSEMLKPGDGLEWDIAEL